MGEKNSNLFEPSDLSRLNKLSRRIANIFTFWGLAWLPHLQARNPRIALTQTDLVGNLDLAGLKADTSTPRQERELLKTEFSWVLQESQNAPGVIRPVTHLKVLPPTLPSEPTRDNYSKTKISELNINANGEQDSVLAEESSQLRGPGRDPAANETQVFINRADENRLEVTVLRFGSQVDLPVMRRYLKLNLDRGTFQGGRKGNILYVILGVLSVDGVWQAVSILDH